MSSPRRNRFLSQSKSVLSFSPMSNEMPSTATEKVEAIQSLGKKLGKTIIAFSCRDIGVSPLKDDELAQIRDTEKKMGVALVAVK